MYGSQLCANKCAWKITLKKYQCQRGRAMCVCYQIWYNQSWSWGLAWGGSSTIRQVTEVSRPYLPPLLRGLPSSNWGCTFLAENWSNCLLTSLFRLVSWLPLQPLYLASNWVWFWPFILLAVSSINVNMAVDMNWTSNRTRKRARNLQIMQSINITKFVLELNSFNCNFSFILTQSWQLEI